MSFKEALEHYQKGTASEAERAMVEEELEKARLIEKYRDAEWKEQAEDWELLPTEEKPADVKNLRSRLRRHNLGLVLVSVLLALLVFAGVWFGLLPLMEKQYWNPEENSFGLEYSGKDLDLMLGVYNELFEDRQTVLRADSQKVGFASYELSVQWWDLIHGGDARYSVAKLERGKLELPPELRRQIAGNAFERASWPQYSLDEKNKQRYRQLLQELPEYLTVTASVSFKEDLTMAQLIELQKSLGQDVWFGWIGVRNSESNVQRFPLCGFDYGHSGIIHTSMNEVYPGFQLEGYDSPEALEQHFKTLLTFMKDREEAERGVGLPEADYYQKVLDYVEENGVMTYGCTLKASPKTLLRLLDEGTASQIWPNDVDFKI